MPCPISTASSKAGGYVGSEPPHKAAVIPGAAELSVARVYIRCAPAHSDISVGTHISVGLHLGKLPGATPCYSPHKSVGTRSGVVPGAPVGVLASWDVGAPRAECAVYSEKKEGPVVSSDLRARATGTYLPTKQFSTGSWIVLLSTSDWERLSAARLQSVR